MILVEVEVKGKKYYEPFSKGILARSLTRAELDLNEAYDLAQTLESKLLENNVEKVTTSEIVEHIIKELTLIDPESANKYIAWRNFVRRKDPLIILIGGASGIGTSSIAFELANYLGIKNTISSDMVREVMRKIVSKELSPVIHESSYTAKNVLRIPPPLEYDPTIFGYKNHVETVSVGVEALIERALKEGISMIIEGVHVVPGFIKQELLDKENVIMFTLSLENENLHKDRFYSRCRQAGSKRPLQRYLDNFESIRKIHDYNVEQAKIYSIPIIENIEVKNTIDLIIKDITKRYGEIENVK